MDKKELGKLLDYARVSQNLRDCYGWDGRHADPVTMKSVCDMQSFFAYLSSQVGLKKIKVPDVTGHPNGGLTLEWEKLIKERGKYKMDFLALTFFGDKTVTLESDLEYLGIKNHEEFDLTTPLNNTIIQHVNYF